MLRAGLYIRVSTEEQALHGYSLTAQREALTKYAQEHSYCIVDYYMDEGLSRSPAMDKPNKASKDSCAIAMPTPSVKDMSSFMNMSIVR